MRQMNPRLNNLAQPMDSTATTSNGLPALPAGFATTNNGLPALPAGFNPAFYGQPVHMGPAQNQNESPAGLVPYSASEGFNKAWMQQKSNVGSDGYDYTGTSSGSVDSAINASQGGFSLFGDVLGGLGGWLGDNASGLAGIGSIAGALDNASDIRDLGYAQQNYLEGMGQDLADNTAFQGYGVSSGAGSPKGSVTIDPVTGGAVTDLGVGIDQTMMNNGQLNTQNALTGMGGVDYSASANKAIKNSLADPSQRQGEIFNQLMAMQNPMLDQQQAQQQAREHAMGRGGVMGSQFGGTAEDAAMAKARAQASNEAALGAMKQADAERGMFGQMGAAYGQLNNDANSKMAQLGMDQQKMSYLPMEMQMKLMGLGQANSTMQQTGQLTGQDYLAQLGLGGANANINAQKVSSELMGNLYNSVLSNLGGQSGSDGSGMSGIGGLLSSLGGGLDSIFGGLFD